MAFELPDKPSIAVLPFENLSGDPQQEYLSDGISEAIINALSKVPRMFVIARNSSFTYKGKPVKIQQVAEELGVRYVLEGSVQRSGEKLRVTAQLIDALNGHPLWSERYDIEMGDLLAVQDKIALNILVETQVQLTDGEKVRLLKKETNNLKAYEKYLQGFMYYNRTNREDMFKARQLFEEAIRLDPDFSSAYRGVAGTHLWDSVRRWSQDPDRSWRFAIEYAKKALALDENSSYNLTLWSAIHERKGEHEKAIELARRALEINPNNDGIMESLAGRYFNAGRYEEAIPLQERAGRLNPFPPARYYRNSGLYYWFAERYEDAIAASKKALHIKPDDISTFRNLAAIYAVLGKEEKAHADATEVLRLNPDFSIERHFKNMPWKDREGMERFKDALRKAGLPDGKTSLPLPDKPSIAVLPFVNMSDDPKQEYFSDGLTEEIITALSKVRNMFVIARNSTFTYKDKAVKVKQVAEELGVRYVLEGSVRKSENRLRITTQLIDAVKGHHVWAERYDRELKDIFGVQDEITKKVIIALQVELTEGEQARIYGKGTDNFEAYEKFLRGLEYFLRFNEGDNVMARQAAEEAIAFDPEYAAAYVMLGFTHLVDVYWGKSSQNSMEQALEAAQRALALDEYFPPVHNLLGAIYRRQQQWEKAIAEGKRTIALNPNYARGHVGLAETMLYAGRFEEAIELLKKAMRLNPYYHPRYIFNLGLSYQMAGHYEEALKTSKEYLTRCEKGEGDPLWAHIGLTEAYMKLGREEARAHAAEVLKINPNCSLERVRESLRFKDPKHTELYLDALRKAGLK